MSEEDAVGMALEANLSTNTFLPCDRWHQRDSLTKKNTVSDNVVRLELNFHVEKMVPTDIH